MPERDEVRYAGAAPPAPAGRTLPATGLAVPAGLAVVLLAGAAGVRRRTAHP